MDALDKARTRVVEARARLAEAAQTAGHWHAEHAVKTAEHSDLAGRVGELALDDPGRAVGLARDLATLTDEIGVAAQAASAAIRRVELCVLHVLHAEADIRRDRSAAEHADAVRHQEWTDKMLDQVAEHEGVAYGPKALPQQFPGVPMYPRTRSALMFAAAQRLADEAAQLDALADSGTAEAQASRVAALAGASA